MGGVGIIRKCLRSSNIELISETLLFVVHLLWDEEHAGKLTDLADPALEEVAVRLAAFSMRKIVEECDELRKQGKVESDQLTDILKEKLRRTDLGDPFAKEQLDLQLEEIKKKGENEISWLRFETDANRGN